MEIQGKYRALARLDCLGVEGRASSREEQDVFKSECEGAAEKGADVSRILNSIEHHRFMARIWGFAFSFGDADDRLRMGG